MMDAIADPPEPPRPPPEPPGRGAGMVRVTLLTGDGAASVFLPAPGLFQRIDAVATRPIGGTPVAELARSPQGRDRLVSLAFRGVREPRDATAAALLALWISVHGSGLEGQDLGRRLWGLLATEGRAAVLIRRGPAGPVVALASRIGPGR